MSTSPSTRPSTSSYSARIASSPIIRRISIPPSEWPTSVTRSSAGRSFNRCRSADNTDRAIAAGA
jgi:hypothetical protein